MKLNILPHFAKKPYNTRIAKLKTERQPGTLAWNVGIEQPHKTISKLKN